MIRRLLGTLVCLVALWMLWVGGQFFFNAVWPMWTAERPPAPHDTLNLALHLGGVTLSLSPMGIYLFTAALIGLGAIAGVLGLRLVRPHSPTPHPQGHILTINI